MTTQNQHAAAQEHQKSREASKTKPNFKTFAEENLERSATGRRIQTITTPGIEARLN